jgi:hypothetical protein
LNETESRVVDLEGAALVVGCWERAADVAARPMSRTSNRAMRFILKIGSEFKSSGVAP